MIIDWGLGRVDGPAWLKSSNEILRLGDLGGMAGARVIEFEVGEAEIGTFWRMELSKEERCRSELSARLRTPNVRAIEFVSSSICQLCLIQRSDRRDLPSRVPILLTLCRSST
jgi:hypothetical protein